MEDRRRVNRARYLDMRSQGKTLLVVVLIVFALALAALACGYLLLGGSEPVASKTILEMNFTQSFPEHVPEDPFARSILDGRPHLGRVVEALGRAADDERVVAIVARVGAAPMGLATLQELRDAVTAFRASGKKAVAFSDTFGEWGPSNGGYYLASGFDEIYLQPSGDVGVSGLRYEIPFLAGTLEKLGLEAQLGSRHEYKNAINTYTQTEFTRTHEEALRALAESQFEQIVHGISEGRSLGPQQVRDLFDGGPYFGQEAVDAGLVEALSYRDEVHDRLTEEFGQEVEFMDLMSYARRPLAALERGETVALIYGVGGVVRGESQYDPLSGLLMGADTVSEAFRSAIDDPKVRAVLFRVDSPGGSYVAADTIWRETVRARDSGKPVIVSMGDVAASGGYYVAAAAERIVAQPGTITGSIGVYGGKIVSRGLWSKLGISWDAVSTSANADMWSTIEEFGERGWERMNDSLDRIYGDFVGKVADGRKLDREEVEKIARGRVWTGAMAKEIGLVDELGGYPVALAEVRKALGLEEDAPLRLKVFPRPRSAFEVLVDRLSAVGTSWSSRSLSIRVFQIVEQMAGSLRRLGLLDLYRGPLTLSEAGGMR
jgi:protease-4